MAQIASTPTSIRRSRGWAIAAAALACLLVAASASAATQDLRSPDARAGAVAGTQPATQDLRSPDASDTGRPLAQPPEDMRSPDASDAGRFVSSAQDNAGFGGSDWVYLALAGGLLSLAIGGSVLLVQRHRHHAMAAGS
jgi:hypothetical protein